MNYLTLLEATLPDLVVVVALFGAHARAYTAPWA